jgi:hypothetical protein
MNAAFLFSTQQPQNDTNFSPVATAGVIADFPR